MIISSRDDETHWSRHFDSVDIFVDGKAAFFVIEAKEGEGGYVKYFDTDRSGFPLLAGDDFKVFTATGFVQFVGPRVKSA